MVCGTEFTTSCQYRTRVGYCKFRASYHCAYLHFNSILQVEAGQKGGAVFHGDRGHPGSTGDPGALCNDGADRDDVSHA